jgi:imidazolonepropionase-like amidohydrolase
MIISFAASGTNLFAGTGGGGVFLSTNNGTNWTSTGLTRDWVTALAVSGTNLFAGTGDSGVFLSTNNGTNWTSTGLTRDWVTALAVSGTNLFAGTFGGGVFLSTNNGKDWTAVNKGLRKHYINALAVSGTNLFAGTWGGGVFLSTNNGTSWTAVNSGLTNPLINALAVSGTNLFAGTEGSGVFLSTNNGTNWASTGLTNTNVFALAVSGTNLFAGTYGGGVLLSTNNGTSWTAVNNGLTNTNVFALAVSGTNLLAGTQGGVFLSTNNSTAWTATGVTNTSVRSPALNPFSRVKTIRAARVLDGRGAMIENGVIEVIDSKIAKVDQRAGPVTYDLGNATVLPGLIDVHVHLTYFLWPDVNSGASVPLVSYYSDAILANARTTLMAGFTTVQSVGASDDKVLRDAIAEGVVVGPRVLTSLEPIWGLKRTPEELRALVRKAKADGADVIKFFTSDKFLEGGQINVTQEQVDAVCAEAKAQGLRCVIHAHSSEAIMAAVKAGCTEVEHGFFADDAAIQAMAKAHVYFDPNIGLALQVELENQPLPPAAVTKIEQMLPRLRVMFQKALAAGLRMPMGTDVTGGGHGQNAREIIARVAAGQKPMDAIVGATSLAAESLRMEKTIGTIAPGYEADIIAVGGDPSKDIAALRDVIFVMKSGEVYKR